LDRRRNLIVLIVALGFAILFCGGLVFLLAGDQILNGMQTVVLRIQIISREDDLNMPQGEDDTVVRFSILPGSTARSIGEQLNLQGLLDDPALFTNYVRVEGLDDDLAAGTFFLRQNMSIVEIADTLTRDGFTEITLTIFPGQRIEEIAETIDSLQPYFLFDGAAFLRVVGPGAAIPQTFAERYDIPPDRSLEGFLPPETYRLSPEITPEGLRDVLLNQFNTQITDTMLQRVDALPGYTFYGIVTLASIIERETIYADEQPMVSSVYRNRLDITTDDLERLDADPTVQYGHPASGPGNWWPRITANDYYTVNSPYNTYLNNGLPPGPIANPALSAIQAAIDPEASEFLFFRADCRGDNRHDFFTNYNDHQNAC
jgi:UPF0755 protein